MKKHASHVRLFVALAALGMAGLSTACSEINPASPSSLPGSDIISPTEEVPESGFDIPMISAGSCSDFAVGPRSAARSEAAGVCAPEGWRRPDRPVRVISDRAVAHDPVPAKSAASATTRNVR